MRFYTITLKAGDIPAFSRREMRLKNNELILKTLISVIFEKLQKRYMIYIYLIKNSCIIIIIMILIVKIEQDGPCKPVKI